MSLRRAASRSSADTSSRSRCCMRTEIRETPEIPPRYAVRVIDIDTGKPVTPAEIVPSLAEARRQACMLIARVTRP